MSVTYEYSVNETDEHGDIIDCCQWDTIEEAWKSFDKVSSDIEVYKNTWRKLRPGEDYGFGFDTTLEDREYFTIYENGTWIVPVGLPKFITKEIQKRM